MVSIVQYLFYAVRIVWQEKMPPTRRRTAECYWLVEVRFCHDMGAIYRVGVFILQFPAAGKSIAGFSDGNFPAGIIVQDSLSPRIVLAAAAADVHFKPVGEFRSLAQRRTIALHFRAAKVLLDALSVRFADIYSFFQNGFLWKYIDKNMVFGTVVWDDPMIAEYLGTLCCIYRFTVHGKRYRTRNTIFAVPFPKDGNNGVVCGKYDITDLILVVDAVRVIEMADKNIVFRFLHLNVVYKDAFKALASLVHACHIQNSLDQILDSSGCHGIQRTAGPQVNTILDNAAFTNSVKAGIGHADKLHTKGGFVAFGINVIDGKIEGVKTDTFGNLTKPRPTTGIPFCHEFTSETLRSLLRQTLPFFDIAAFFDGRNCIADGSEKIALVLFLIPSGFVHELLKESCIAQILGGNGSRYFGRIRNCYRSVEVFSDILFVLQPLAELRKRIELIQRKLDFRARLFRGFSDKDACVDFLDFSFYKNGYLQNLEKIREDEKFYDAYSEKTWEHMEINGEIYGIPSYSYEGNGLYYVFNQQYLDKYNVDISQVTGDLQTLYPILTELSEKEKDNKAFVPLHSYEYMIYAPEYTEILDTIRVKEGMEKPIAENLLNNEQVKESVLLLNEFHKNGLLKEGSANTLANGNFFVMLMYADDPELLQEYFDTICEENNKKPLSLKYVKIGEHYPPHRTGGMNSVLKGGNTEKAIDLLKRTVTDEEISNLLKYGTEEMEETPAMLQWMFGNDQWSKEKNAVKESLIAGFQFDGRVYKEQIDQLSQIYYSYSELFRGLSENPQEDYEKMMQEMEAAGINAITEEVNNQLDQWYNTVR